MQPASWPCNKFAVIAEKFAAEQEAAEKGATEEVKVIFGRFGDVECVVCARST